MTLLHSTRAPVRFEPPGQPNGGGTEDKAKAYFLKTPTKMDKAAYRRALAAAGAVPAPRDEMRKMLREGVEAIFATGDTVERDQWLGVLDAVADAEALQEVGSPDGEQPSPEALDALQARLEELGRVVRRTYPPYAQRFADNIFFAEVARVMAVRHFVTDWEGFGAAMPRGSDGFMTDGAMEIIPDDHMAAIDERLADLMALSETDAKNSDSPSPGDSSPMNSAAASTEPQPSPPSAATAGTSNASAGST